MTAFQAGADYGDGRREERAWPRPQSVFDHTDPASKRIIVGYGFWIFLLSDIIMFSAFFATYAVLSGETAGGPSGKDLFDLHNVAIETACLLLSSFTCGLAAIGARAHNGLMYYGGMAATCVLGLGFLAIEIHEFVGMIDQGAGPTRSAFLSAFFTLVGCHGVHVTLGTLWLLTMIAQVFAKGYRADILRRVLCFALFWHTLDIIWVAIFTVVYLFGAGAMSSTDDYQPLQRRRPCSRRRAGGRATRSRKAFVGYLIGLGLAILLTAVAFFIAGTSLVWHPSIPIALVVLAIAQIGVHLVFFLHITTGPDNVNNVLALAFGVLIVFLIIIGSLWIMYNLNQNMAPMQMPMG